MGGVWSLSKAFSAKEDQNSTILEDGKNDTSKKEDSRWQQKTEEKQVSISTFPLLSSADETEAIEEEKPLVKNNCSGEKEYVRSIIEGCDTISEVTPVDLARLEEGEKAVRLSEAKKRKRVINEEAKGKRKKVSWAQYDEVLVFGKDGSIERYKSSRTCTEDGYATL